MAEPGNCIYCGSYSLKLTDEHIVPLSFGASGGVLPAASCEACAKVTRDFEQTVARTMYGRLRVRLNMPTRHPKDRPTHFPLRVRSASGEREARIPAREYPRLYAVFRMPPPGILEGRPLPQGLSPPGLQVDYKGHPEDVDALREKGLLKAGEEVELSDTLAWGPFNRFLAKIAHAFTAMQIGRVGYDAFLPPLILGDSAEYSHYVGGFDSPMAGHILQLEGHPVGHVHYLTCKLWLILRDLPPNAFPMYHIVVGRIHDPEAMLSRAAARGLA